MAGFTHFGFSTSANVGGQEPQPTPSPSPRRALPKPVGGSRGFAQYEKRDASVRLIAATATRPIDPARAFYDSGTTAFNNGDYQKAVRDFSQAIKLSPDWPEAHYSLAVALTEVEKPKEAIEQFEQVLKLDPTDQLKILSSYNIGNAQSELGENEAAVEAYKRAIQIDPKLSKPHNNLGLAYAALSRISEALAELMGRGIARRLCRSSFQFGYRLPAIRKKGRGAGPAAATAEAQTRVGGETRSLAQGMSVVDMIATRPLRHLLPLALLFALNNPLVTSGQKPQLIVQTGHTGIVSSLQFIRNGRSLISVADTVILRDVQTGQSFCAPLKLLPAHQSPSVMTETQLPAKARTTPSNSLTWPMDIYAPG